MAMKSLAAFVNPANGVLNASDKQATIDTFSVLTKNNERYDPDEIESWLILKANFPPKFVGEIMKICVGIMNGKSFRSVHNGPVWRSSIINIWRDEVKDPKENSEEF